MDMSAVEVLYFGHPHDLMSGDGIEDDYDKYCDGCGLFISGLFFYCSPCGFYLHKACIEMPSMVNHWSHRHSLIYITVTTPFQCYFCLQSCTGFCYCCNLCVLEICARCATISNPHHHPGHKDELTFSDIIFEGKCAACGDGIYDEKAYRCRDCIHYGLDLKCLTLPLAARHRCDKHILELVYYDENDDLEQPHCDICKERRLPNHWFYRCSICNNSAHPKCALGKYPFIKDGSTLSHKNHPHPLISVKKVSNLKSDECVECGDSCQDLALLCESCDYLAHFECLDTKTLKTEGNPDELPKEINHLCHRIHPLSLKFHNRYTFCEICKKKERGYFYGCSPCNFHIHIDCAVPSLVIENETHVHSFNLFWRQGSFICDACGTEGNYASYICSTCHLQVHEKCTSLPRIIKTAKHYDHSIFHNYFVQGSDLDQKHECRVCYKEVKKEHGCYSCLRQDCKYIVHVNCAIVEGMYWIIDSENEDDNSDMDSSITRVIEVNERGEAVRIEHFSHGHDLLLGDKIKEDDDKCCDGCVLPISGLFYYCSQCDFFLHKTCAELPRKKHHWFHNHRLTLESIATYLLEVKETKSACIFECRFCLHVCSGFFHCCYECDLKVCLRCASIPHAHQHSGHKDHIFLNSQYKGKCTACGCGIYHGNSYKCKDCTDIYALDYACLTLPLVARHKCDKHILKLVYHDENDDPEQHYCDICEEKRDPNHWFYFCSICDNSAHPKCVLGKNPFIKIGSTYLNEDQEPRLTFTKKIGYYPKCFECGKPCQDLTLENANSVCYHFNCVLKNYLKYVRERML
ncbi:uncharacterized protein LOC110424916 [Herrania umbratica]|uniref:Uncharacterized protein LOC110424916 n=1 Tax=Herrania umbratica TaxID=108875 RepID=A0A6J1B7D1_9ROSI|nr:uncharacterized protein LOC110424916 [Herrania umbratica]